MDKLTDEQRLEILWLASLPMREASEHFLAGHPTAECTEDIKAGTVTIALDDKVTVAIRPTGEREDFETAYLLVTRRFCGYWRR